MGFQLLIESEGSDKAEPYPKNRALRGRLLKFRVFILAHTRIPMPWRASIRIAS
jgi:hypothetical protein